VSGAAEPQYDVAVVGAGMGGIYAVRRFTGQGLSVLGLEGAADVGGVWYHNRYPGARVDVEGYYYCFFFDPELYQQWEWTERYPAQPEILSYLNHVADRYDVRRHYRFNTWVTDAVWDPDRNCYLVTTDGGESFTARYLVMTTGQLSKPRKPAFEGLDDFTGEWVQTSVWPDRHIDLAGKRVGVIGTGSSGVQAITEIAKSAAELVVFQRTANYSVPARNGPMDQDKYGEHAAHVEETWAEIVGNAAGSVMPLFAGALSEFDEEAQQRLLEERWDYGGHTINAVFSDQGTSLTANAVVADFVRSKVREIVEDPAVAEKLVPTEYPIGSRRLCVDTGYYETFNRDNVTLVDVRTDPIERITPDGIRTRDRVHELDVIVFALGFNAFTGALDNIRIRNEHGQHPTEGWKRGPQTYLGLTTTGFPNLFIVTGPGSPSVLANMIVANVQHIDFIGDCIHHMDERGYTRVEPTEEAQTAWSAHVAEVSSNLLRLNVENYMVHVNDDGTRVFMPYAGGMGVYAERCDEVMKNDFEGFEFK
jgi:cation diffusion facilitator CzcD-associated flavoprotein CzcO